jgi:hypothetical protein
MSRRKIHTARSLHPRLPLSAGCVTEPSNSAEACAPPPSTAGDPAYLYSVDRAFGQHPSNTCASSTYAVARLFLRKVGGGYRMLMDYFMSQRIC